MTERRARQVSLRCFWQVKNWSTSAFVLAHPNLMVSGHSFPEPVRERGFVVVRWECINPAEVAATAVIYAAAVMTDQTAGSPKTRINDIVTDQNLASILRTVGRANRQPSAPEWRQ